MDEDSPPHEDEQPRSALRFVPLDITELEIALECRHGHDTMLDDPNLLPIPEDFCEES